MAEIICDGKTTRDINTEIKRLIAGGETDIWHEKSRRTAQLRCGDLTVGQVDL